MNFSIEHFDWSSDLMVGIYFVFGGVFMTWFSFKFPYTTLIASEVRNWVNRIMGFFIFGLGLFLIVKYLIQHL